jgi:hypothetical protein
VSRRKTIAGETIQAQQPEWQPLLDLVNGVVDDFMWMFEVELEDGRRLHAYKHRRTRRYLHLDAEGRAFAYTPEGRYLEVDPVWALPVVLSGNSEVRGSESGPEPPSKP